MAKSNWLMVVIFAIIGLLVGGFFGAMMFPVMVEVPKECPECPECLPCICEECPQPVTEIEEVPLDTYETFVLPAVDDFLEWMDEEEEYLTCGRCRGRCTEYDIEQIEVRKIYDDYKVEFDDDEYEVCFKVKLKYLDEAVEEKCYRTLDVCVFYEPDEEPQITVGE